MAYIFFLQLILNNNIFYYILKTFFDVLSKMDFYKFVENWLIFKTYLGILELVCIHYSLNTNNINILGLCILFIIYFFKLKDKEGFQLIDAIVILIVSFAIAIIFWQAVNLIGTVIASLLGLDFVFTVGPEGSSSGSNNGNGSPPNGSPNGGPNQPDIPAVPVHDGHDDDGFSEETIEKEELVYKAIEMKELFERDNNPSTPLSREERIELEEYKQSMDAPINNTEHTIKDFEKDVDNAISTYESSND